MQAEFNANRRAEWEAKNKLKGTDQWMLPSVMAKIDKKAKKHNKRNKSEKKSKKDKKRHRRRSSSSSSSTEEDLKQKKRSKKKKKKQKHSTSSSSSSSDSEDEWVEKKSAVETKPAAPVQPTRDDWMSGMLIPTYGKEKKKEEHKGRKAPNAKDDYVEYDPSKCDRELNRHWKNGNNGLPSAFKRPDSDDDDTASASTRYSAPQASSSKSGNWRKRNEMLEDHKDMEATVQSSQSSSSEASEPEDESQEPTLSNSDFLTDQQINELAAKVIKAELLGDDDRAKELNEKLVRARDFRTNYKERQVAKAKSKEGKPRRAAEEEDERVLLTKTNAKGYSRPLQQGDPDADKWGGRQGRKVKKQKVATHVDGERLRFFGDDDKYTLKQMFEAEKMTTSAESDSQFMKVAAKLRNKNDDLEDIFSEEAQKRVGDEVNEERERSTAIREHQEMQRCLENCDRCFDSPKMEKQLIVSLGENSYISLPSHEGLQMGHCLICPMQHVSCTTMLDEDVWEEVNHFMKSLVKMFRKQGKDCIFFETVRYLNRKPHMTIHCVPSREFEMAAFYFKKAIQESEAEWAQNRQLVDLKKEKKTLRQIIPKGLPYFWVDFGDGQGFAHIVEDQERFPSNFAQEIIGGMLGLDAHTWRRPRKEQNPISKVKQFADWWAPYESK